VPWTTLEWGRVLDDTSEASVTVAGSFATGENRCKSLAGVYPWEHEVALYRDTYRVWSGPIVSVQNPGGGVVTLKAMDLSRWLDERFIHTDHDYPAPGSDVAVIFRDYVEDAMLPDNTPGLSVSVQPTGVVGVRSVKASEYQVAGAAIRELARTGIDWTMLDRVMYAGGQTVPQTTVLTLLDTHLATPPTVTRDGLSQLNRIVVAGSGIAVDGPSVIGEASDPASEALDGLLEGYASESEIGDVPSATAAAQTRLDLVSDTPTLLSSVDLDQTAPFSQTDLIAGILVDLRLTETDLGPVIDRYRIASIKASADSSGAETVTLNFQPKGTE
jgi:hypothetical protein